MWNTAPPAKGKSRCIGGARSELASAPTLFISAESVTPSRGNTSSSAADSPKKIHRLPLLIHGLGPHLRISYPPSWDSRLPAYIMLGSLWLEKAHMLGKPWRRPGLKFDGKMPALSFHKDEVSNSSCSILVKHVFLAPVKIWSSIS